MTGVPLVPERHVGRVAASGRDKFLPTACSIASRTGNTDLTLAIVCSFLICSSVRSTCSLTCHWWPRAVDNIALFVQAESVQRGQWIVGLNAKLHAR